MTAKVSFEHIKPGDIVPYDNNPRDNEAAIEAVRNSIEEFGFLVPVVVDDDNVLVAGHTRLEAITRILKDDPTKTDIYETIPAIRARHLTKEQIDTFRIVDNKTSELADWDFDKLATEIAALTKSGIDMVQFGWKQEELDCLSNVVALDCLGDGALAGLADADDATSGQTNATPDGINTAHGGGYENGKTRDGLSARIAFGGMLGFFVLTEDFDHWWDEQMKANDYNPEKTLESLAEKLGLKEAYDRRKEMVSAQDTEDEGEKATESNAA
jgi:hypothetical protein